MRLILATVEIDVADGIALFGRQDVEIEDALVNLDVILLSPDILGSATAVNGTTIISTTLRSGEIGIVKIGEKAVKVVMK